MRRIVVDPLHIIKRLFERLERDKFTRVSSKTSKAALLKCFLARRYYFGTEDAIKAVHVDDELTREFSEKLNGMK